MCLTNITIYISGHLIRTSSCYQDNDFILQKVVLEKSLHINKNQSSSEIREINQHLSANISAHVLQYSLGIYWRRRRGFPDQHSSAKNWPSTLINDVVSLVDITQSFRCPQPVCAHQVIIIIESEWWMNGATLSVQLHSHDQVGGSTYQMKRRTCLSSSV